MGHATGESEGRVPLRRLTPERAVKSFDEVILGYSINEAVAEASRILEQGLLDRARTCLFGVDVPQFVTHIANGDFNAALATIAQTHRFPGILGRHCTRPCEVVADIPSPQHAPNISALERAAAEYGDWSRIPFVPGHPSIIASRSSVRVRPAARLHIGSGLRGTASTCSTNCRSLAG